MTTPLSELDPLNLIEQLRGEGLVILEPQHGADEVASLEGRLGISFPPAYRAFLAQCGNCQTETVSVFGISERRHLLPSVEFAVETARRLYADFPHDLVPIQSLGGGTFYCLVAGAERPGEVVRWPFVSSHESHFANFSEYLRGPLLESAARSSSLTVFSNHAEEFDENFTWKSKLPRNDELRPLRFCVRDILLGFVAFHHSVDFNCLLVDTCLVSDPPQFDPNSGARMMVISLLSEAFKFGGSLEVRFSNNVEGGRVPRAIVEFAAKLGIRLSSVAKGLLLPHESREFYLAASDFSEPLIKGIRNLSSRGLLSPERACYTVHHGVWTRSELESIVLGAPEPDALLAGGSAYRARHIDLAVLSFARMAVLGGWLDRKLLRRERTTQSGTALDLEDDVLPISIAFDPSLLFKRYVCLSDTVEIPWDSTGVNRQLPAGDELCVLIRARDLAGLDRHISDDIKAASEMLGSGAHHTQAGLLVPRDFDFLADARKSELNTEAKRLGVSILVCPETAFALDVDARRRMDASRILRQ